MRFSFSTNAFTGFSVFHAVERIASLGYEGVELLADVPHLYADSVTDGELIRLKAILDRTGLTVANINANTAVGFYKGTFWEPLFEPSLAHPNPELRRWRLEYSKKCVDIAHFLNAPSISVTSGRPCPGVLPEQSLVFLNQSLQELVSYAESQSVRVGIEYEPGLLLENSHELLKILDALPSPYLGANLDLGHSHVLGECPETVIAALSDRVFHVHLEDIRGTKHFHLVPGDGDMDFPRLLAILDTCGYDGFVTVELYTFPHQPEEAAQRALTYLLAVQNQQKRIEDEV